MSLPTRKSPEIPLKRPFGIISGPDAAAEARAASIDTIEETLNWHIANRQPMHSHYDKKEISQKLLMCEESSEQLMNVMQKFIYVQCDMLRQPPPEDWGFGKFYADWTPGPQKE